MGGTQFKPLPTYPVFHIEKRRDPSWYILIAIIVVILTIVAAIIVYAIRRDDSTTTTFRCAPGLCTVDLTTGVKVCPSTPEEILSYDPATQTCSSTNYCQSQQAPCAVLANGALNCDGVCGPGNNSCRCVQQP